MVGFFIVRTLGFRIACAHLLVGGTGLGMLY